MSKTNVAKKAKVPVVAVIKPELDIELKPNEEPVKITSTEIEMVSSEFHNFGGIIFEKDKPILLTVKVLNELEKLPNFKDLVDKGVIVIEL